MLSIYRLPNQLPDEKIIKILRRHLFILFKKVLVFLIMIIIPFGFFTVIMYWQPDFLVGELTYPLMVLAVSVYYLFVWLFFFFIFIDYYLDAWIITSERIIDIDQEGFFSRTISEQRLTRVQDVTSEVKGFLPTLLKYGDVFVQTAAEQERFIFMEVPNAEKVRDLIIKQSQDCKAKHPPENQDL
jgi:membrane protein YdbS with pleckstrin-like domain